MPGDADAAAFALTPSEEQLLALIRDGRVDAEIAVRLAISNAEVKDRIERLAAKLGAPDRAALRRGMAVEPTVESGASETPAGSGAARWAGWRFPVAVAIGVVIGVAATWMGLREHQRDPAESGVTLDQIRTSIASLSDGTLVAIPAFGGTPTPAPTASPTPRITTVSGRPMLDAGQLFNQPGHPVAVAASEARESLLVITLNDASTFVFDNGAIEWHLQDAMFANPLFNPVFGGRLGDSTLTLALLPANSDTRFLPGDVNSLGIYSSGSSPPAIAVWVDGHHAEIGIDGHLYIDPETFPRSAVIAQDTGELLDVSGATRLGHVDGAWTRCGYDMPACDVISRPDPRVGLVIVPADGILHCRDDGVLELNGTSFTLLFHQLDPSGPEIADCEPLAPAPLNVKAGSMLSNSRHYRIEAFTPNGTPLSVVVAGDGTLYVGDISRKFGCPCRGGT